MNPDYYILTWERKYCMEMVFLPVYVCVHVERCATSYYYFITADAAATGKISR